MHTTTATLPDCLESLPGYMRAEIEAPGTVAHHFIRWLLQTFEANLRLAESIAENSAMLLDPDEIGYLPGWVEPVWFSPADFTDPEAFLARLTAVNPDAVSQYLRSKLSKSTEADLRTWEPGTPGMASLLNAVSSDLNQLLRAGPVDDAQRFSQVHFSPRTRALRRLKPMGRALLQLNRSLLEDAYPESIVARPEASLLRPGDWELDVLKQLAAWVAFDLNQDWFNTGGLGESSHRSEQEAERRVQKLGQIIKRAVPLYRQRGTPHGLRMLLKEFYDWDVDVIEQSWPHGMQIGITSVIGVNTWLIEEPQLDRQFVVLLQSTPDSHRRLPRLGSRIEAEMVGLGEGRKLECFFGSGRQEIDQESGVGLMATVSRLRRIIDQECPAHTRYYLAFAPARAPAAPPPPRLPPLRIEMDSVIEGFWLN